METLLTHDVGDTEMGVFRLSRRRNNLDIMADVLEIAQLGAKKTWIVYKANLNFDIVKGYLTELTGKGFIENNGRMYHTTDQGLEFLEEYRNFSKFVHGS